MSVSGRYQLVVYQLVYYRVVDGPQLDPHEGFPQEAQRLPAPKHHIYLVSTLVVLSYSP